VKKANGKPTRLNRKSGDETRRDTTRRHTNSSRFTAVGVRTVAKYRKTLANDLLDDVRLGHIPSITFT
jgi:hypothetical protein